MSESVEVAKTNQLAPGRGMLVRAGGQEIALFNVEGSFYAVQNSCPHSTGPLAEGRLSGTIVTCPWHGSQFDLATGECLAGPADTTLKIYPVRVEDQSVLIQLK